MLSIRDEVKAKLIQNCVKLSHDILDILEDVIYEKANVHRPESEPGPVRDKGATVPESNTTISEKPPAIPEEQNKSKKTDTQTAY